MDRATTWALRTQTIKFDRLPKLMGIVNVTPDSFSDGGRFYATDRAIEHALRMVEEGADIIDVGGESTRPYSQPVDTAEELRRVVGVIQEVCRQSRVPLSIDTSKADVARRALEAGAEIINDVTGLSGDPQMESVAVESGAGLCAMHMRGNPRTMQDDPQYEDVVTEIHTYLQQRRDALLNCGIRSERICLDPGIGFGKTHQHNLALLAACGRFHDLGCPLLVGHSRKGFIAHVIGNKDVDRLPGTLAVSIALALQRVQVLRVHNVAETKQALALFDACGGLPPGDCTPGVRGVSPSE